MANNWSIVTVDEIKADTPYALATGPFGSSISAQYFRPSGVPVIRGSNLSQKVGVRLSHDNLVFLDANKAREFERSKARHGDLVFTCWGTINQVGLIDGRSEYAEYVVSNKQMKLTPDPRRVDSLFLYYLFSGPTMQTEILNRGIGSSVPGFNLGQLRALTFQLPPLQTQKEIAAQLGALDDKIELNRRMNETLEALARALFQSWFVDFDPVRAKAEGRLPAGMDAATAALFPDRFEDSALGEVPEGWRVGPLGTVASNRREGVLPEEVDPSTPYIGLEHMPRGSIALGEWGTAAEITSNKAVFAKGDILFGKLRPYFRKVGVAIMDGVCSTDILVISPITEEWFGFVLGHTSSSALVEAVNAASTGTKMPRTNWGDIARYQVALPPVVVAQAYNAIIEQMVAQISVNILEARTLAELRDTLLPKLMSGESN